MLASHSPLSDGLPNSGMLIPNMGIKRKAPRSGLRSEGLADALFTNTQQRVLAWLFGQPERSFYATELIGLAGAGSGAVQRELARLERSGLVTTRAVGNQKHYQANPAAPIYAELAGIVQKTVGLAEPLRNALAPLAARIHAAFVYGSIAKREDTALSDIDLMVISDDLTYSDLYAALEAVSNRLGRTVNPTVITPQELAKRIKRKEAFATRVLAQPKIWLIGSEDALVGL
jgi:predicted nucleotidyltransferase